MLSAPEVKHSQSLLAHELGHHLGLYHTFNAMCPNGDFGMCNSSDLSQMCDPAQNLGDTVSDTPLQRTQGVCTTGKDSCASQAGADPIDNIMSYSGCGNLRFTAGQVAKMQDTIRTYFPATTPAGGTAADLPCDPCFPNGVVPSGYKVPKDAFCGRRLQASYHKQPSLPDSEFDHARNLGAHPIGA